MWISKYTGFLVSLAVGIVFLLSGIIKLNDPLGFSYKIEEYLYIWASQLTHRVRRFLPCSRALAVGIATLEAVLGVALLAHWQRLWTLWALLSLTLFFTCLTLYTATSKRLASCGCFGDALVLTPWQSFVKSGVLLLLLGGLCGQAKSEPTSLQSYYWVGAALLLSLGMSRHTLRHLPLLDLLPYKVGNDLTRQHPEVTALSTNLCVWREDKEVTQAFLVDNKLLIIIQHPASIAAPTLQKLDALIQQVQERLQPVLIAPSSQGKDVANALALPLHTAHPMLLKTMLRAPLGLLLLKEGIVANKWHYHDLAQAQNTLKKLGWLQK